MNALTTLRDAAVGRPNAPQDDYEEKTLLGQAVHTALAPLRIATSRPAVKAYITTILFFFTSFVLISISTTAYFLFYYNYIPQIGLTQEIYLQYDANTHPHASVPIDTSALISQQPYDIFVSLHVPRTPANMAAGNFMLDLSLLPEPSISSGPLAYLLNTTADPANTAPLAHSRRPAILPYNSHLTSLTHKLLHLPTHLLSLRDLDAAALNIPMFERLSFGRGRANIPKVAYLEIQSQAPPSGCPLPQQQSIGLHLRSTPAPYTPSTLQVYSAQLHFHTRFEGLRYYVYNYRILSFLIFSSLFYSFALSSMAIAYAFVTAVLSARNPSSSLVTTKRIKSDESDSRSPKVKDEELSGLNLSNIKAEDDSDLDIQAPGDMSSTERTFPTLGRNAQPLRYTPSTTTVPSEDAESVGLPRRDDATHDAEDEDDDDDGSRGRVITPMSGETQVKDEDDEDGPFMGDSGIGTSMDSEARASASGIVRRRSSRGGGSRGSGSRR